MMASIRTQTIQRRRIMMLGAAILAAAATQPASAATPKGRTAKLQAAAPKQELVVSTSLPEGAAQVITIPQVKGVSRPPLNLTSDPWGKAACITGFVESDSGKLAAHPTWVYLYYDPTTLWVAFRCEGQNGNELRKEITERDGKVWRDDSVEVKLDPTGNCKHVYQFIINAAGQVYDALDNDNKWNAQPIVRATADEKGWSATIGIPFAALKTSPPEPGQAWTANFFRNVAMRPEEATKLVPFTRVRSSWVSYLSNYVAPQHFGHLLFGPEKLAAVRMRLLNPVVIGKNHLMTVDRLPGLQFTARGVTADRREVFKMPPQPADQGTLSFVLTQDSARRIEVSLADAKGDLLARTILPVLSPEASNRLQTLLKVVQSIEGSLSRLPAGPRQQAQKLLGENKPRLDEAAQIATDPAQRGPAEWDRLNKTVTELELKFDDPACLMRTVDKLPEADFAVGLESPMRKVMIRDFVFEGWFDDHFDLALAGNEHEGFQVVALPFERDLKNVKVAVSPLQSTDGQPMTGGKAEVALVGHVDVAENTPYQDVKYTGWYPDPLLNFQNTCDAKATDNVAFWIDVATSKDTPAGQYQAMVTVTADNCRPISLKLNVTVWDFVLPDGTNLRNAFTYHEPGMGRFYGGRWDREMRYKYYDFLLDHRLNIDHLYRGERPDIEVIRYGVSRGMNAFHIGGEFRQAAAQNRRSRELDDYIAQLKKEDLFQYAYSYGYDEVGAEKFPEVRQVFGNLRRMFPGLETMTTAADHSFGKKTRLRTAVDIWVPVTDWYNQEEAHELRKEGREMWWYICVVPYHPFANFFVEYPAIEPRLLTGAMSYKYEAGGFLYYMINQWDNNKEVVGPGPYTKWDPGSFTNEKTGKTANGDGSLLCPGPDGPISTIRMENLRDGFEDYDYLYLLRQLADAVRKQGESAAAKAFLARADKLLAVPDNVVRSVIEFTIDPKNLDSFRTQLAQAILEGRKLAGATGGQ